MRQITGNLATNYRAFAVPGAVHHMLSIVASARLLGAFEHI